MKFEIKREKPSNAQQLQQAVYQGVLFIIPANSESNELISHAKSELINAYSRAIDLQKIHKMLPADSIYQIISSTRKAITTPEASKYYISKITASFGLLPEQTVCDLLRLRWNTPQEEVDEEAIYRSAHRDTWYANPQCQINWWIPLFDVSTEQTFTFFPDYFDKPIPNTSANFDYDLWSREIGFQTNQKLDSKYYPTVSQKPEPKNAKGFSCKAGDIVIFSGAHLHQTAHNKSEWTRFSIDFRTVNNQDKQQKLGAPNVDNHSTGDASIDYLPLG